MREYLGTMFSGMPPPGKFRLWDRTHLAWNPRGHKSRRKILDDLPDRHFLYGGKVHIPISPYVSLWYQQSERFGPPCVMMLGTNRADGTLYDAAFEVEQDGTGFLPYFPLDPWAPLWDHDLKWLDSQTHYIAREAFNTRPGA